jgi:hypothetical protein
LQAELPRLSRGQPPPSIAPSCAAASTPPSDELAPDDPVPADPLLDELDPDDPLDPLLDELPPLDDDVLAASPLLRMPPSLLVVVSVVQAGEASIAETTATTVSRV